jgi:hypothetical protein
VTDIVFLRKRAQGEPTRHVDANWLHVAPLAIDGAQIPVNRYFLAHPLCGPPHKGLLANKRPLPQLGQRPNPVRITVSQKSCDWCSLLAPNGIFACCG